MTDSDPAFLRVYASTDDSPTGRFALAVTKMLLRVKPCRVLGIEGPVTYTGAWAGYRSLMTTPTEGAFVNVVVTSPSRWIWTMSVRMPNRDGTFEMATDTAELWTAHVRNVLITDVLPEHPPELDTARKYDAIIVPSADLASQWSIRLSRDVIHLPLPGDAHAWKRDVLGR